MGTCAFEGCDRPIYTSAGWCNGHYQQWWSGREMKPLRRRSSPGAPAVRDEQGRKQCLGCEQWRDVEHYCVSVRASDGLHSHCRDCMKRKKYLARYGVTPELVEELREAQGGRCRICDRLEEETGATLVVDHQHDHCSAEAGCPDCVRGLLCRTCNSAIGQLGEDPRILRAAAAYIETNGRRLMVA